MEIYCCFGVIVYDGADNKTQKSLEPIRKTNTFFWQPINENVSRPYENLLLSKSHSCEVLESLSLLS